MKKQMVFWAFLGALAWSSGVWAGGGGREARDKSPDGEDPSSQEDPVSEDEERFAELARQVQLLAEEIEKLQLGRVAGEDTLEGRYGLAPSASKVYGVERGASLGGYGDTFEIHEGCVASSGSDQQGFDVEGQWFSHILDPRTGWPVRDSISATVVGKIGQAMRADALATAGFVAGPEGALDLWQRFGVEGTFYFRAEGTIQSVQTPGFPVSTTAP